MKTINTDDRLILFLVEKFDEKSITAEEFKTVIKYLQKMSLPVLDKNLKSLIQAFTDFLLEQIHNPKENDHIKQDLPLILRSIFELLLYRFTDQNSVFKIAKSCINISSHAPEKLKNQCESIIKTILQHNQSIALKLMMYCAGVINESNRENIQKYLIWFLEAENHRIINSLDNHLNKLAGKIFNKQPKPDTFTLRSSLFLCPFLRFSSKSKNPILQQCIVNAFEAIIKQDLRAYHNCNSEILELTFKFLIKKDLGNYQLALSLLKVYISCKANFMPKFIKGAYEELRIESPETANELAKYCEETNKEDFVNYIKHSMDYWSQQDDTPKTHAEIEGNGVFQLCCQQGLPHPRHFGVR